MKHFTLTLMAALVASISFGQLVDSDFSTWTDGVADGWYGSKSNIGPENAVQADNDGGSGDFAVELINATTSHKRFSTEPVTVEAGVNYEVTFWARGNGDLRSGIFDDRVGGFGYYYNSYVTVNSTDWVEYNQSIVAEESTDIAEFILSVRNTSGDLNVQVDRVVIGSAELELTAIFDIQFTEDPDGISPLDGSSVFTGGIVTGIFPEEGFWIQNNPGPWQGIFVFSDQPVAVGDSVTFSANVIEFFGMTQLSSVSVFTVVSNDNDMPATVISTDEVNDEAYEGVLAQVVNATCINPNSGFGQFIVNDGSGNCLINRDIYDFMAVQNEVYSITGLVFFSFDEFKLMPRTAADVDITTGLNEWAASDVAVFPVPAASNILVNWQALNVAELEYRIFDTAGRVAKQGLLRDMQSEIDVTSLNAGMYTLNLGNDQSQLNKQIIIAR